MNSLSGYKVSYILMLIYPFWPLHNSSRHSLQGFSSWHKTGGSRIFKNDLDPEELRTAVFERGHPPPPKKKKKKVHCSQNDFNMGGNKLTTFMLMLVLSTKDPSSCLSVSIYEQQFQNLSCRSIFGNSPLNNTKITQRGLNSSEFLKCYYHGDPICTNFEKMHMTSKFKSKLPVAYPPVTSETHTSSSF